MNNSDQKLTGELETTTFDLLNRRVETSFREALLEAAPTLDLSGVSIVSDLQHTEQLTIHGVDDETLDRAVSIFQRKQS